MGQPDYQLHKCQYLSWHELGDKYPHRLPAFLLLLTCFLLVLSPHLVDWVVQGVCRLQPTRATQHTVTAPTGTKAMCAVVSTAEHNFHTLLSIPYCGKILPPTIMYMLDRWGASTHDRCFKSNPILHTLPAAHPA